MKEIPLTQGKVAIVDDNMFDFLNQWKWCFNKGYAVRFDGTWRNGGTRTKYSMHRVIMQTPPEMETDHKNQNKLDNRRENLRICTHAENRANSALQENNTSGFKGVILDKRCDKWYAHFRGKHLGCFSDPEVAACAYDTAAKTYFGEFARLNFYI